MSPEQAEGKKADARSDVFSFGAVLYEMVTGRMAFRGDSAAATLAAVLEHDPPPPRELVPGLPADLEKLLQRCLRKDPAKRYQSMADVALDLDEIGATLEGAQPPAARPHVRRSTLLWLAASLAGLTLVALAGWLLRRAPAGPPPPPKIAQLTSCPGMELYPTFSPDGTQVAFAWNGEKRDNFDVYVTLVGASGPPLRLTTNPASDTHPAWAPDGRQIAFRRRTGVAGPREGPPWSYAIMALPALGGPERKVADLPRDSSNAGLAWTPDGRWLVTPAADPGGGTGIFLYPVDRGECRQLTSNPSAVGADNFPALSRNPSRSSWLRGSPGFLRCPVPSVAWRSPTLPGTRTSGQCGRVARRPRSSFPRGPTRTRSSHPTASGSRSRRSSGRIRAGSSSATQTDRTPSRSPTTSGHGRGAPRGRPTPSRSPSVPRDRTGHGTSS